MIVPRLRTLIDIERRLNHKVGKCKMMMQRCNRCHASLKLVDSAILWLCPVCGGYGAVTSFARDDYPQRYVPSFNEYGLVKK